jgi:hypothetical protein
MFCLRLDRLVSVSEYSFVWRLDVPLGLIWN